ncbi:hypothetical protein L4C36_20040 [Photobacterium japonica]|uniref:hypothetical protein n=1 Tax=Photobacterium japonica TaxID=2910235 RepID=UPI003D0DC45B
MGISGVVVAEPYLTLQGYGDTQHQAEMDAKQQLALRIYSKVDVSEETRQSKVDGNVSSHYEMRSTITSLPIEVQYMETVSVNCDASPCLYQFQIDKTKWIASLKQDVAEYHDIISDYLTVVGKQWRDIKRLEKIQADLLKSEQALIILSSLDADDIALFQDKQSRLTRRVARYESGVSIAFRGAADSFASEMKAALTASRVASAQGDITVYIKTLTKKGKQANQFVAKQTVLLQIFEANNPSVVVAQKQLSAIGKSLTSSDSALEEARQQIIKTVKTHSIYSLLD